MCYGRFMRRLWIGVVAVLLSSPLLAQEYRIGVGVHAHPWLPAQLQSDLTRARRINEDPNRSRAERTYTINREGLPRTPASFTANLFLNGRPATPSAKLFTPTHSILDPGRGRIDRSESFIARWARQMAERRNHLRAMPISRAEQDWRGVQGWKFVPGNHPIYLDPVAYPSAASRHCAAEEMFAVQGR